jgi:hypothetical protein
LKTDLAVAQLTPPPASIQVPRSPRFTFSALQDEAAPVALTTPVPVAVCSALVLVEPELPVLSVEATAGAPPLKRSTLTVPLCESWLLAERMHCTASFG